MAVLTTENLSYSFAGRTVLRDLSLHFEAGALISIMGANGAGKTTLLRLMLGLLRPETGRVLYQGKALTSLSRRQIARAMAYVPQRREALPAYTVAQVVELGRLPHGSLTRSLSEEERQEIDTVLSHLDLHSFGIAPAWLCRGENISGFFWHVLWCSRPEFLFWTSRFQVSIMVIRSALWGCLRCLPKKGGLSS